MFVIPADAGIQHILKQVMQAGFPSPWE